LKASGQCPLVLSENVGWKEVKALGNEEGKAMGNEGGKAMGNEEGKVLILIGGDGEVIE
jgi:hypothetical protein